jgi:hypothetical protein
MLPGALKCSPRKTRQLLDCEPPRWCRHRRRQSARALFIHVSPEVIVEVGIHSKWRLLHTESASSLLDGQHERVLKLKIKKFLMNN